MQMQRGIDTAFCLQSKAACGYWTCPALTAFLIFCTLQRGNGSSQETVVSPQGLSWKVRRLTTNVIQVGFTSTISRYHQYESGLFWSPNTFHLHSLWWMTGSSFMMTCSTLRTSTRLFSSPAQYTNSSRCVHRQTHTHTYTLSCRLLYLFSVWNYKEIVLKIFLLQ